MTGLAGEGCPGRTASSAPLPSRRLGSAGTVEGQVNRLKVIKREMYGRAGFELLRCRVLAHA
jgi:hypothetical protein